MIDISENPAPWHLHHFQIEWKPITKKRKQGVRKHPLGMKRTCLNLIARGWTKTEIHRYTDVPYTTIRRWMGEFETDGA